MAIKSTQRRSYTANLGETVITVMSWCSNALKTTINPLHVIMLDWGNCKQHFNHKIKIPLFYIPPISLHTCAHVCVEKRPTRTYATVKIKSLQVTSQVMTDEPTAVILVIQSRRQRHLHNEIFVKVITLENIPVKSSKCSKKYGARDWNKLNVYWLICAIFNEIKRGFITRNLFTLWFCHFIYLCDMFLQLYRRVAIFTGVCEWSIVKVFPGII